MDKSALRDAILSRLEADLALQTSAALSSREEAVDEESRPENKYDMRSQEAAYLAEGQARLAAELQESLALFATLPLQAFGPDDAVALGALVTLSAEGSDVHYFLGPRSGGTEVAVDGTTVLVITPASPLGRQLLGRWHGDSVMLPGARRPHRITKIA
jgi:transcription elongation GreA/GreB family factor